MTRLNFIALHITSFESTSDKYTIELVKFNGHKIVDSLTLKFRQTNHFSKHTAPNFKEIYNRIYHFVNEQLVIGVHIEEQLQLLRRACNSDELNYPFVEYCCSAKLTQHLRTNAIKKKEVSIDNAILVGQSFLQLLNEQKTSSLNELLQRASLTIGIQFATYHRPITIRKERHLENLYPKDSFTNKTVVFTGSLKSMLRSKAARLVHEAGGVCSGNVTQTTDFVVIGSGSIQRQSKTTKQVRAERFIAEGHPVKLIDEETFLHFINSRFKANL